VNSDLILEFLYKHLYNLITMTDAEIYKQVVENIKEGINFALATVITSEDSSPRPQNARMIIYQDGKIFGTIGGGLLEATVILDAKQALLKGKSVFRKYILKEDKVLNSEEEEAKKLAMVCGGVVSIYIEVFWEKSEVIIMGGGHVGLAIANTCDIAGLPYIVVDDRKEFANRERFKNARQIYVVSFEKAFEILKISKKNFIVIVTRGHRFDSLCLKYALATEASYIGMIGSKSKVKVTLETLAKEGVDISDKRIFAPIGLNIGDHSPGQIAISIIAEILSIISNNSSIKHMRDEKNG